VPGAALYMMHVSAGTGVAAIAEARSKGLPVYGAITGEGLREALAAHSSRAIGVDRVRPAPCGDR